MSMSTVLCFPVRTILLGMIAVSLMSACQTPWTLGTYSEKATPGAHSSNGEAVQAPVGAADSARLVEYANGLSSLDPAALEEEHRRVQENFSTSNDPNDRMRLVILLLEPDAPFRDVDKARRLLEDYLDDPVSYRAGAGNRGMALFLFNFTESAKHLGATEAKLKRQLDSERLQRESLARRLASTELELETVRAERRILQKQVEALKNIEETLRTRDLSGDERPR